jgi:iron(III) transport system substrate-binding protein
VWGLAASSLAILDQQGMLQSYAPKDLGKIGANYRDAANPPAWVGMDVWAATICFNTVEAEKQGLSKPVSWQDLTKPEYKGKIVMPNPASSGTGFLDVSAWLQTFGEKQGWAYMDGLHQNIGQYVHSGSKPCKLAAAGEFPIGISFEYPAVQLKRQGAPLDIILPKEGLGWEIEATAVIKGTPHEDAAKKLADFSASPRRWSCTRRTSPSSRSRASPSRRPNCRRLRAAPDQERLRLGFEEPRRDPDRMAQAL